MGAFEDFVNNNLGLRTPLFIDTTTPESSSIAAGSIGSKFIDSTTSFLYEKTGYTNADWVKIAELGEPRGGSGINFSNLTGGLNIEITGWIFGDGTSGVNIHTPCIITGCMSVFDHTGIVGTGDDVSFGVTNSGQVGINLYTGHHEMTGINSPYHFHVSGTSYFSGRKDFYCNAIPAVSVQGDTVLSGSLDVDDCTLFVSDKQVGINVCEPTPGFNLHTSGKVLVSGATSGTVGFEVVADDPSYSSPKTLLYASPTGAIGTEDFEEPFIGIGCSPADMVALIPSHQQTYISGGAMIEGGLAVFGGEGDIAIQSLSAIESQASYVKGQQVFSNSTSGYWFKSTTSTQRDALPSDAVWNKLIHNTTVDELQFYNSDTDTWVKIETGTAS